MKKNILLFCLLTIIVTSAFTQDRKELFILYKADWSQTKDIESAAYFMQKVIENDTTYVCRFYQKYGPMIQMETYRDSALDTRHGLFAWYNRIGDLDSMGTYYLGKKNGRWDYGLGDSTHSKLSEEYANGTFIKRITYFKAMTPAKFKKRGLNGWESFLYGNLKMPERYTKLAGSLHDNAVVTEFEINKEGIVSSVFIVHSCEWSIDMESIRVIKKSPPWSPAIQNGEPIIYRHRQSITFMKGF